MITEIFISYPWWTIVLVLLIGLVYASLLYVKNSQNKLGGLVSAILAVFRFLSVSALAFLLLSPYIRTKKKQIEKPIVIIGHDNSSSILLGNDSVNNNTLLLDALTDLKVSLSDKSDVESYTFGEQVVHNGLVTYSENLSNYSEFISTISSEYAGLNVGAVLIVGDGNYNAGIDPVYAASDQNYPIYTVALGDTTQNADIKIDEIRSNSIVYTGDIFPIEVSISADMLSGQNALVTLYENNKEIGKTRLNIVGDNFHNTHTFNVVAAKAGKKRYRIVIDNIVGETVTFNNSRNIFVDVMDSRLNILLLGAAPHPDLGAIKQSLDHNPNFDTQIHYISSSNYNINDFDIVVLYQIPSNIITAQNQLNKITESGLPLLYIVGKQTRLSAFNRMFVGLKINSSVGTMAMAQFEYNGGFSKFTFNNDLASQLSLLPPLVVVMGNYQVDDALDILTWQKISDVVTDFPLVAYYSNLDIRNAVLLGEGLWMWRIQSYVDYGNTSAIDALLSKTVMYLTAENDKRRFKILSEGVYDNRNDIELTAELYNEALERDNSVDIELKISNENGELFNYVFLPYDNYYSINLSKLPVGIYKYEASTKLGNEVFADAGEFIVTEIDYESRSLVADHRMLSRLAKNHNGEMYYADQVQELGVRIGELETMKSKIHYQDTFTGLNTIVYIMLVIIALLSIEWFLRKYYGNY